MVSDTVGQPLNSIRRNITIQTEKYEENFNYLSIIKNLYVVKYR